MSQSQLGGLIFLVSLLLVETRNVDLEIGRIFLKIIIKISFIKINESTTRRKNYLIRQNDLRDDFLVNHRKMQQTCVIWLGFTFMPYG